MSWLDTHKKRMSYEGTTIKQSYEIQSANFLNHAFQDSPTFLVVTVDEEEYDARLITDKRYSVSSGYEVKKLLLRPYEIIPRGKIAKFNDEDWLVVFYDDKELAPKCHIRFCNNFLKFKNGNSYPCVIDNKVHVSQRIDEESFLNLPADRLVITISYNEDTKNIRELDRFIINGVAWEVQGFDSITGVLNGEGIMEVSVQKVPLKESEKPVEVPDPPIEDNPVVECLIEIVGANELEVGDSETFIGNVLLDGVLSSEKVSWSCSVGSINQEGVYTAPSETGKVSIIARYIHASDKNSFETVQSGKIVEIFDNNDWGW